jgi:hypothetical protein
VTIIYLRTKEYSLQLMCLRVVTQKSGRLFIRLSIAQGSAIVQHVRRHWSFQLLPVSHAQQPFITLAAKSFLTGVFALFTATILTSKCVRCLTNQ